MVGAPMDELSKKAKQIDGWRLVVFLAFLSGFIAGVVYLRLAIEFGI